MSFGLKLIAYKTRLKRNFNNIKIMLNKGYLEEIWISKLHSRIKMLFKISCYEFDWNFHNTMNLELILFSLERRLNESYGDRLFAKFGVILEKLYLLEVDLCAKLSIFWKGKGHLSDSRCTGVIKLHFQNFSKLLTSALSLLANMETENPASPPSTSASPAMAKAVPDSDKKESE